MWRLIWTQQWSLLNIRIWTFSWVWHKRCNSLFNIRNLVSSLILMFYNHIYYFPFLMFLHILFVCVILLLYTWFGKKWKRLKKFSGWKTCLVYAYFFKHLRLSMLISFMLIKKRVYLSKAATFMVIPKMILSARTLFFWQNTKNRSIKFKTEQTAMV